ncbi:SWIM zinc finger family protein [Streptomyces barringtoniae]|uniref:SWIM zinc finger family protein n=1 Tax=Streptomyces barringtoniae TaxID=2892029 RepID=UPI001E39416F|nr:SWIM zinc finger family protein [Streptomyces barringtoniae]MCC5476232.1 SWIM zinc finger family protein [Streptomyces barringtoniae]
MTAGERGEQRPADAARRALREARRRAETARAGSQDVGLQPAGSEEGRTERAGAEWARGERAGAERTGADRAGDQDAGDRSVSEADRADARGVSGADRVGERGVSGAIRAEGPPVRPADVAREALRSARREALRAEAEAEEAAARGRRSQERRTRRGPRATGGSGSPAPRTPAVPGPDSPAARAKAAQDMRHYLANAFRMPVWSDTPEDETPSAGTSGSGDSTETADPTDPIDPTEPRPVTAPAGPDPTPAGPGPARDEPAYPPAPPATSAPATPTVPGGTNNRRGTIPRRSDPAAASPHVPASMATPHRDSELRRTFPEFAPRETTDEGVPFAGTWWGNAWVAALEQGALDPKRLARGRGYADQGHVDAITVTPGLVLAYVRGSRPRPYRVQVRVRTLEDTDWARFLDAAADRPGHIAALLDKELPQSLADCGVPLLPGPGDLVPRCSCPDSGHPCKHAAALCYQTARLLDADPFVLLLLRGRGERSLLDALSRRSAARAARAAQERQPESLPGMRAADALAPRQLPPLPPPLPVPPHPEQPPVYPAAPGGPDPFALDQLATDAAARAHALLGTGRDPVGELTLWQDAVRLAAARPGSGLTATTRTLYATLATAVGRTPAELARAVAAWRQGGAAGLAVLEEPWDPPAGRFDRARPLLLAADLPAFRPWRNRLTHPRGHVQLRLGRDGLWYAYESEPGQDDWWPRGTPDLDPVGALTGLGTPDDA